METNHIWLNCADSVAIYLLTEDFWDAPVFQECSSPAAPRFIKSNANLFWRATFPFKSELQGFGLLINLMNDKHLYSCL